MSADQAVFAVFSSGVGSGPNAWTVDVLRTLSIAGFASVEIVAADDLAPKRPPQGWAGSLVSIPDDERGAASAWAFCRDSRKLDDPVVPTLVLIGGSKIAELAERHEQFDDFLLAPFHPSELEARLGHLLWRSGQAPGPEQVEIGPLALNLETYQASLNNRPLDLTYMEYELLKFLALSPGKVYSREVLLNRVWGYEYYGGARTVDVHVRRLRAKFGEEFAHLIQTVRSVGYKLDHSR
jgi:DNA-binding response OmpR family regulator